jgi:DNA recombination protein RmuC
MSNTIIIILLIALILVIALLFFVVLHRKQSTTAPVTDSKELTDLKDLVSRIKERTDNVANEVTRSGKTIDDLHNRSTKITNINDEVKKLTDVFLNSKARGNIGENILHNILEGIYGTHFPECIQEQYIPDPENSNNRIDAVIKTPNQLIGIDSKFPYDNYRKYIDEADKKKYLDLFNKDVKNRIKEVEKYFNKETNLNYIILYIPSDEIFNFINEKLFETYLYGIAKNIYICSSSILAPLLRIMLNNTLTANYEQKLQNSVEVLQQIVDLIVKFSEN